MMLEGCNASSINLVDGDVRAFNHKGLKHGAIVLFMEVARVKFRGLIERHLTLIPARMDHGEHLFGCRLAVAR